MCTLRLQANYVEEGAPVAQCVKSNSSELEPRSRRNFLNLKQGSTAHSLSLSSAHRPDMTEILMKMT